MTRRRTNTGERGVGTRETIEMLAIGTERTWVVVIGHVGWGLAKLSLDAAAVSTGGWGEDTCMVAR